MDDVTGPWSGENAKGFAAFVAAHQGRLFRFVLKQVGNRADAEDITQETFLEAYRSADRFRGEGQPEAWLFGIAVNVGRAHLRRDPTRRRTHVSDEALLQLPADGRDPLAEMEMRRHMSAVSQALFRLPDEWREVLVCVVMEGFSYDQTADILGVPVGTIRSRLSRARDRLKSELAACAETEG